MSIEEPIKGELFIITAVSLLFGYVLWTVGSYQFFEKPKQYQEAPCSEFASLPLNEIPARCVTPDGGYKR